MHLKIGLNFIIILFQSKPNEVKYIMCFFNKTCLLTPELKYIGKDRLRKYTYERECNRKQVWLV